MKQKMVLEESDVKDAVIAFLEGKGYKPVSTRLQITPPTHGSPDPRENGSGTIRYECEVEPSHE